MAWEIKQNEKGQVGMGGLWMKTLSSGTVLFSGKFSGADFSKAIRMVTNGKDSDEFEITIWVESDKTSETHPDARMVLQPKWEKKEHSQPARDPHNGAPAGVKEELTSDDIPF
jgi:hypothetical protein|tara:strand:+ start:169 stop:507 length:339 start_codon:yes stop_codon:yes gene_type:complete